MANPINTITLSTGKVVKIPIFFNQSAGIASRAKPFLRVWSVTNGSLGPTIYDPYTDAEIVEFLQIVTGKNYNSFAYIHGASSDSKICAVPLFWYQTGANNYVLCFGNYTSSFELDRMNFGGGHAYYNGASTSQTDPDFYQYIADHPTAYGTRNYRSSTPPTLDYYYAGFLTSYLYIEHQFLRPNTVYNNIQQYITNNPNSGVSASEYDPDDPYGLDTSTIGGGDGSGEGAGIDTVEKIPIPELPTVDISNCGFLTIYNPTKGQLASLASYLWSNLFDIDTFKKLFSDPMECIIGLGVVPVVPTIGSVQNVKFGSVDSGIPMSVVTNQYVQKSMGSISIKKYVGCFLDYSDTQIEIYLPYIGVKQLDAKDIMGDSITLTYNIDVLSGACAASIYSSSKGLLYQFNGSCITNIPLTSINYSQAIQNAISILSTMASGTIQGASGNAIGGMNSLASAANIALNSRPHVAKSGAMGGAAGMLSSQKPYIIITRPRLSVPDKLNKFIGNTSNITMNLSKCSGMTVIEHIILNSIPCTDEEKKELDAILKKGIIL